MSTTPQSPPPTHTLRMIEADVRAFAAAYPGPNVDALLAHCESGRIGWSAAWVLAQRAMRAGLDAVAAGHGMAAIHPAVETRTLVELTHRECALPAEDERL